jgi:glycosyltransferase involved in cell wall biosynthesis
LKKVIFIGMPYDQGRSGISRYIEQTLEHLSTQVELDLIMMESDYKLIHQRIDGVYNWLSIGQSNLWKKPIFNIIFHCLILPIYCLFRDVDYVFFPAGNRRFPLLFPRKTITMVHDFSHLHVPGKYDLFRHLYVTRVLPFFLDQADLIFTPSQSTKNDLLNLCRINSSKVRVNLLGYSFPKLKVAMSNQVGSNFLYVSRVEHPGKNHIGLIKAFEIFCKTTQGCENVNLRLVGGDWSGSEEVHSYHSSSFYKDKIFFLGHLSEEDLEIEYKQATALIYPSFYEGFGLPLLEAMSRGLPVVSSDRGSLPEVGLDAVIYIDPENHQDIAKKMKELIESPNEQNKYIQLGYENLKRFSWVSHIQNFPH